MRAALALVEYDPIGKDWVRRFILHHPELASVTLRTIEAVRVKDASAERLQCWFSDLQKVNPEYNIKPEKI